MPSLEHEAVVMLFRNRPALAAELLQTVAGITPPVAAPRLLETELTQIKPIEYRADLVVALGDELRVVVEVQLSRDEGKRWSWPLYVAALRAKERRPVHLLVFTTSERVAAWARRPIALGHPGFVFAPIVAGPASIPLITEQADVRDDPELAILSAITHGDEQAASQVALAAIVAVAGLDLERAAIYHDLVMRALSAANRNAMEELMSAGNYEFKSEFALKHRAEGKAEGRAEGKAEGLAEGRAEGLAQALLTVLRQRGITATEEQRARITRCDDEATLQRWLGRALTVESLDQLFD